MADNGRYAAIGLLALALAAGCTEEPAPPFEVEGAGGVEGLVFYDADRDGTFDQTEGDYLVPGVDVVVTERGTQQAFNGATATTGANGRFVITGLPPGTHDLRIDTTTVPPEVAFCQNPVPVTVYIGEMPLYELEGRSGCVISIAEAEALDPNAGEFITLSGIVTSAPGMVRGGYTFIEDETGGLRIFDSGLEGQGIGIGDRIEVSGTLAAYRGDLQLTGATVVDHEVGVAAVVPMAATTAEITAAGSESTDPLLGRLVTVEAAEITEGFGTLSNNRNAKFDDGSGTAELRVEWGVVDDATQLPTLYPAGSCFTITGVVGTFDGTGQLFPRTTDDIEAVPCN